MGELVLERYSRMLNESEKRRKELAKTVIEAQKMLATLIRKSDHRSITYYKEEIGIVLDMLRRIGVE